MDNPPTRSIKQIVLTPDEIAGLKALIADPDPSTQELKATLAKPRRNTFTGTLTSARDLSKKGQ